MHMRQINIQEFGGVQELNTENQINKNHQQLEEQLYNKLRKCYNHNDHQFILTNYCFRSHWTKAQFYLKFIKQQNIQIQQPRISKYFSNECFANLEDLGKWLSKNTEVFPIRHIPKVPENLQMILDRIWDEYGYIPNLQRLLLFYPNYLEKFKKLQKILFQTEQLNIISLYFISVCTAAQLGSIYVLERYLKKFLKEGGNPEWFTLGNYPVKFKDILLLNRKLIRCPWEINQQLFEQIANSLIWSHKQIAIFCQTISFVHHLCTIALAMGLQAEQNAQIISDKIKSLYDYQNKYAFATHDEQIKYQKLEYNVLPCLYEQYNVIKETMPLRNKDLKKSFRKIENQQQVTGYMRQIGSELTKQQMHRKINECFKIFLPKFQLIEKRKQAVYKAFDYSDFNLKQNAYPVFHNLVGQSMDLIIQLIQYSENMTLNNFGSLNLKEINTHSFRKAIRYYAENLLGYTHFQYNYKENLKDYLTMPLKFLIRLLTISPTHITKQVLKQVCQQSQHIDCFDKGHITVMIACSKMNFGLLNCAKSFSL